MCFDAVHFCCCCFWSDGDMEWEEEETYPACYQPAKDDATDFDSLLREAQQKLYRK